MSKTGVAKKQSRISLFFKMLWSEDETMVDDEEELNIDKLNATKKEEEEAERLNKRMEKLENEHPIEPKVTERKKASSKMRDTIVNDKNKIKNVEINIENRVVDDDEKQRGR